jgi:hypothetical protein
MAKKSMKEKMAERRKEIAASSSKGNYKVFIFKEGTTRLRGLPVPEDVEPAIQVRYIFISKELGGIVSPSTWGDKCAFNEKNLKLKDSKDEKDKKLAKKVLPKTKYLMPAVRYKDEHGDELDVEAGAKLALLSGGMYQDLIDLYLDDKEAGDFTDPKNGYDVKITRTGTGQFDTEYSVRPCKATKLSKKFAKDIYDPEEMARALTPTYEETKELLKSFLNTTEDDDEEKPTSKDRDKKKKKKNRDL